MRSESVIDEVTRLIKPWSSAPLLAALRGEPSLFEADGDYQPHSLGRPRGPEGTFDGQALLAGAQALSFLSLRTPVGDPLQQQLPRLYAAITERLKNPKLLLFGGIPDAAKRPAGGISTGGDSTAIIAAHRFVYFCPVRLSTHTQRAYLRWAQAFAYPNETYPWSSLFSAYETFTSPGFARLMARTARSPLEPGQWEMNPRSSAPALVARAAEALHLEPESAALFLQLLALVDCGDAQLCEANGWSPGSLKNHAQPLVKAGLVLEKKQPRATRRYCLPGTWEVFKPPHPATERWKLSLYGAEARDKALAAPLGRVLPLQPVHELFGLAFERYLADAPARQVIAVAPARDWLAEIRGAPLDDTPRLVYADSLMEQGDARGELIRVQCQLAHTRTPELVAAEAALLAQHEERWVEAAHPFITSHTWSRGFVTHISAHAPTFAKHANDVFEAFPLLEGFCFDANMVGPVPPAHIRAMAGCEAFSRFTSLDTSADHYFSTLEDFEALLASPHLPKLRFLRLGFHRSGSGLELGLVRALVNCPQLHGLTTLELAGQNLGRSFARTLGIEALEVLLEGLPSLVTLRVPYNGFTDRHAQALAKRLEAGLGPALESIDLTNTVDTNFVTKAVTFYRNTVTPEGAHAVSQVLAARKGQVVPPPTPRAPPPLLEQTGRFPFAEEAKSGRSRCTACGEGIEAGSLRIGVRRTLPDVGTITAWVHPACRLQCPELLALSSETLEERLTANSRGVWPPPTAKL